MKKLAKDLVAGDTIVDYTGNKFVVTSTVRGPFFSEDVSLDDRQILLERSWIDEESECLEEDDGWIHDIDDVVEVVA